MDILSPDILIIRYNDGYRVLHGHLRLASVLSMSDEVLVEAKDEGKVTVIKTRTGFLVNNDSQPLALIRNLTFFHAYDKNSHNYRNYLHLLDGQCGVIRDALSCNG